MKKFRRIAFCLTIILTFQRACFAQTNETPVPIDRIDPYNPSALVEGTQIGMGVIALGAIVITAGIIAAVIVATNDSSSNHTH